MKKMMKNEDENLPKIGELYLVSTPIGNPDDITLRAIKVLNSSDLIICEEIKEGARILRKLNISKKLDTLNEQDEEKKSSDYIGMLLNGKRLALISDAGTPVFADPGFFLVKEALRLNIKITVVPGVSSILAALVRCGFPISQFLYAGFLSRIRSERLIQLRRLSNESRTVVILETPYRLVPLLEAAAEVMPHRNAYLGINLTMHFETHHYGTFKELWNKFKDEKFKGEFVICFEGAPFDSTVSQRQMERISDERNRDRKDKWGGDYGRREDDRRGRYDKRSGDDRRGRDERRRSDDRGGRDDKRRSDDRRRGDDRGGGNVLRRRNDKRREGERSSGKGSGRGKNNRQQSSHGRISN